MFTLNSICSLLFIYGIAAYSIGINNNNINKSDSKNNNDTLQLVFVIFRHGERVPETNEQFPNDAYKIQDYYPMTYGEITKSGKQRQYQLGKKLRKKYNDFLGPIYTMDQAYTYSTDWDRTKTSALLLLAGLFPPYESQIWDAELKWLPIPYNFQSSEHDHLLQRPDPYCPRYVSELRKVFHLQEVLDIKAKYKEIFDYVTENTGRDMFDFHEMFRIYQNLHGKNIMNLTIPDWAKPIYPEPLKTIASYQCVFENYNTILKRLNGGHILQKFIDIAKSKINGSLEPKGRKIFLYSGHENNIVNILAVLGLYKQHIPPYCSAVMLELHKGKNSDEYGFKVFYENDTYSEGSYNLVIPECAEFCSFEKFVNLTKNVVPLNYTKECQSSVYLD